MPPVPSLVVTKLFTKAETGQMRPGSFRNTPELGYIQRWLGGVVVKALDLWSTDREFDSRPGSRGQLSLLSYRGTSSLLAGVKAGRVHLCRVAGNTVIPYGRWRPVAQERVLIEGCIQLYLYSALTNRSTRVHFKIFTWGVKPGDPPTDHWRLRSSRSLGSKNRDWTERERKTQLKRREKGQR